MKVLYTKLMAGICLIMIGAIVYENLNINGYTVGIVVGILSKHIDNWIDWYYFRKIQ